jgi:hypothetical protein
MNRALKKLLRMKISFQMFQERGCLWTLKSLVLGAQWEVVKVSPMSIGPPFTAGKSSIIAIDRMLRKWGWSLGAQETSERTDHEAPCTCTGDIRRC